MLAADVVKEETQGPIKVTLPAKRTGLVTDNTNSNQANQTSDKAEKIKKLIRDRILKNRIAPGAGNTLTMPVYSMSQK